MLQGVYIKKKDDLNKENYRPLAQLKIFDTLTHNFLIAKLGTCGFDKKKSSKLNKKLS